jgi:hypothetical protein
MNKMSERFSGWLFHATIPLLIAAVAKLMYDAYFAAHSSDPHAEAAHQAIVQNAFLGALVLILLAIGTGVYALVKRSDPAPRYEYYTYDNELERDMMHKRVIKIIADARESIVAVNAWREEGPPDQRQTQYREKYFDELIRASQRVPYTRLVQVDSGRKIATEFDKYYVDHFKRMLDEGLQNPARPEISLFAIEPVVPATFVIVDDRHLVWQLNEVGPTRREDKHKRFWMRAVVIIDGGEFVKQFKKTFVKALHNEGKRPVKKDELR